MVCLRVGGRLRNAQLPYDAKHQILLPQKHEFTKLIFRHEHTKTFHSGPHLLLSFVRQRFWPINGKNVAKCTVRSCVTCFRVKPTNVKQIMGDLPQQRTIASKPFQNTGVDYCGPFLVKNRFQRKGAPYKVYVASFVCFSTKAVHFEIVQDLTSESFIYCLKRFLSRRGKIECIWSDNATNFVGANKQINDMYKHFKSQLEQSKIANFCATEQIKWQFIPPRAPNFGGLWEASIKSFKHHLTRVTKGTVLTPEEFQTLVIQIEGILNSRPLTYQSSDPNELEPLTPGHFLTGGLISDISDSCLLDTSEKYLSNWQKIGKMVDNFWKRYSLEYLNTLQSRTKWKDHCPNLNVGDIVLLMDDNLQSVRWLLGKITQRFPGPDNMTRVVEVKTKLGNFKRSISKICKLPIYE